MLWSSARETAQDSLRLGCTQAHGCCKLDHHVIVLRDYLPVDRACQYELEVGVRVGFPCFRTVEFLPTNILEPGHELETQQMAESKSYLVLYVDTLAPHLGRRSLPRG